MTNKKSNEKTKNKDIKIGQLIKSPFSYKTFENRKIKKTTLLIYSVILLVLVTIIAVMGNHIENYSPITDGTLISYLLIGLPIMFTLIYGLYYIFLNALEKTRKPFFESLLVTTTLTLPFVLIGNILNYIGKLLFSPVLSLIIVFIIFVLMIYYFISYTISFKNYYNTSPFKVITSLILLFVTFMSFVIVQYLSYLISAMR